MPKPVATAAPAEQSWAAPGDAWPPDYVAVYGWRQRQVFAMRKDAKLLYGAREYYRDHPCEFIEDWVDSYDPRNAFTEERPTSFPFVLFPRQRELVQFLCECIEDEANGLVEKARDMGATWVCVGVSVWLWLYRPGSAVGWGSRKEQLVDKLGDPDSIFEKLRMVIRGLPREFLPPGLNPELHMTYMKIVNPENGATITGEAGDNIGRGGRKLVYFKDESAHYQHPELIEASLGDNTRVQIDISSVNGLGNVFERRRSNGVEWYPGMPKPERRKTRVFILDWKSHPDKSQAWYDERKAKAEADGLTHKFAQEVDRNYSASVEGTIIEAEWIKAAVGAAEKLGIRPGGPFGAALDVADGGTDTNALAIRHGIVVMLSEDWGARDTAVTARKAVDMLTPYCPLEVQYDSIGVGSGVKAEVNSLGDQNKVPAGMTFVPWPASAAVQNPRGRVNPGDADSMFNADFFGNLKAQAWWELRLRFYRTWRWVVHGIACNPDEIISLPANLPNLAKLMKELAQPVFIKGASLKMIVDKTPEGTKSPNLADAVVMAFWPVLMVGQGIVDFYKAGAAALAAAKPATGLTPPTEEKGGIKLYAPPNLSTVFTQAGARLAVENGYVVVSKEDAVGLRAAGFTVTPQGVAK